MSEAKHTPGPWQARRPNAASYPNAARTLINADGRLIATVFTSRGVTPEGFTHGSIAALAPTETEANARLIAKAPEMYELIARLIEQLDASERVPVGDLDAATERDVNLCDDWLQTLTDGFDARGMLAEIEGKAND